MPMKAIPMKGRLTRQKMNQFRAKMSDFCRPYAKLIGETSSQFRSCLYQTTCFDTAVFNSN